MRNTLSSASFISHILLVLLLFTLCQRRANAQFGFYPGFGAPGFGNGFGYGGYPGLGGYQPYPYNFGGGFGNRNPCYGGYFCGGGGYPYSGGYPYYGNGLNTAFASSSGNGFATASAGSGGSGFFG